MKFKNLLTGRKFVWNQELFIKLDKPAKVPSTDEYDDGIRNAVRLSGYGAGRLRGFSYKGSDDGFTQIRDLR